MPVFTYRTVEDMPDVSWRNPGDPEFYRAVPVQAAPAVPGARA
jgi:hypothetical protein